MSEVEGLKLKTKPKAEAFWVKGLFNSSISLSMGEKAQDIEVTEGTTESAMEGKTKDRFLLKCPRSQIEVILDEQSNLILNGLVYLLRLELLKL